MHTRLSLLVCALWVVGAAASSPAVARPSLRAAPFDRPQYLCVNKGFPGGWLIDDPSTFTQSSIDAILAAFGGERGGAARRLCVSFNAWTLIMTPANETTMLRSVDALLSLVETNDLPLSLSLDPTQWWQSVPGLYNWWDPAAPGYDPRNAANVEWTAPTPANATAISWRNWGSQFRMPSPHPNFASPAFRAAAAASVAPLAARIATWFRGLAPERRYLLAYVRAVQELSIGSNYFYYADGNALIPRDPTTDPTGGPAGTMQLGYAAVCGGGGAGGPGCTGAAGDRLSVAQLDGVVYSLCAFAAGVLLDAGIPRSRIMVHIGTPFGDPPTCAPPLPPCAFVSPQAALVPNAQPGWSLYGGATDPAGDVGLTTALAAADGAAWGAPEWLAYFDRGRPAAEWAAALNATMRTRNNRLLVVQNFESIEGDAGPLAAVVAALAAGPACLIDAPSGLASARVNATAFGLSWTPPQVIGGGGAADATVTLLASTTAATLSSGALAAPDVARVVLAGSIQAFVLALPRGFDASEVWWTVQARGCGGLQSAAADTAVITVRAN